MFKIIKKEIDCGGKTLSLETGKIARQASSVIARMGNMVVMANVTVGNKEMEGLDFVPLTISYIEKFYSSGRIPAGFIKRETKPNDGEVLISRLLDRPIRPLFPSNYRYETNVSCTLLSYDENVCVEVVANAACSAALMISKAHFEGPIACAKVGYLNGDFILNPIKPLENGGLLDLTVSGTEDSVLMVESEVKELSEEQMLEAVKFGHEALAKITKFIGEFAAECNVEKLPITQEDDSEIIKSIEEFITDDVINAYNIITKAERNKALEKIKAKLEEKFIKKDSDEIFKNKVFYYEKQLLSEIVREKLLKTGKRIDGRTKDEVRPIDVELDILPSVHGSALFTRGETQSLGVLTLGSNNDQQTVDSVAIEMVKERFMLHYNFPPYSVGECGRLGAAPGRREIGHGKLAWRALVNMLPNEEDFPYAMRFVSEITESNGSSSMATVCSGSLVLMAGGVPIKAPVAGVAMGLIKEKNDFIVLTDIMGDEDSLGDMDFKVAGTKDKITALQMDIKCKGVNFEIMKTALEQAKYGRIHILNEMNKVISEPRANVSKNTPKMEVMKIAPEKIKDVIGPQGKNIKSIVEQSKCDIDIADGGIVKISGKNLAAIEIAKKMIKSFAFEPEFGGIYDGVVVKILDVGAFVQLGSNSEGFVHISELADYRVDFVDDILTEGKNIKVKIIGTDKKGKPKLSYRSVDQKTGADISKNK